MDKENIIKKVAEFYVNNKKIIIEKLVKLGCEITPKSTNKDILNCFFYNIYNNPDFAKYISEKIGLKPDQEYSSFVTALLGAIGSIFGSVGSVVQADADAESQQSQLANAIVQAEAQKEADENAKKMLVYKIVGAVIVFAIVIAGIVILRRNKQKK
jgi:hypothetical protein